MRNKEKTSNEIGMAGSVLRFPASVSEDEILATVRTLNQDPSTDGILVQLPLPKQVRSSLVLEAIDPKKDVDGFHPVNVGALWAGQSGLVPCTPRGCLRLLDESGVSLDGARAVVVGPLEHRRKTRRGALARAQRHRHARALENPRSSRRSAARPTCSSPPSDARR